MHKLCLIALLVPAASRAAAADAPLVPAAPVLVAQAGRTTPPAKSDDDDEDEAPATPAPTKAAPAAPAPKAAAPAPAAAAAPAPAAAAAPAETDGTESQRLVAGAPLFNPNVAVHIIQQKQAADRGRGEVVLYPVVPQINGKFTQHYGSAASIVYHLQENFGFQVSAQGNWYSNQSDFNQELINKVREQATAATSLLLVWGVQGGVEVSPLYGKFAYYEGRLGHFSFVLNAGAGVGGTRMQLRSANAAGPDSYGDTGLKFLGSIGAGFRVLLGDRFTVRLEVRDLVYTARVDQVNGCNTGDLQNLNNWFQNQSGPITSVPVSGGCNVNRFTGTDSRTSYNYASDIPLALNLVQAPSSDVLNNLSVYAGLSFLF